MLNIVIFHNFDYPEGMATTKRFQLFADYFLNQDCQVSVVLKTHQVNTRSTEEGVHRGMKYFRIFLRKSRKYPIYFDKRQHRVILEIINSLYDPTRRNIILTGGVTPEFFVVVSKLVQKWELYCDYLEDSTTLGSLYSEVYKESLIRFIKSKAVFFFYSILVKFTEDFMFRKAKGISAISPYLFEKAMKRAKNVISIPIMANRVKGNLLSKNIKTKTIFFAGTGSLKDGLDIVVESFNNISLRHDVCLKISGKITKEGERLINSYCKCLDKVHILGFMSDADYYSELEQADIMLMSRNNSKFSNAGFPFKLGEYLATGKPVISTRVSGIDQYLVHKKSVFFIEPGNAPELEEGISFLVENSEEAWKIGNEGRKVFEEHFLAEKNCKKLYDFISKPE